MSGRYVGRRFTGMSAAFSVAALLACGSVTGASYRFDMGGSHTPLAEGCLRVTPNTGVNREGVETRHSGQAAAVLAADEDAKNPNYGWKLTVQQPRGFPQFLYRDGPLNAYYANEKSLEFTLYADGVLSFEENTFEFKAEPGCYTVMAVIGDLSPGEDRPGNSIWANGVKVVENIATDGNVKAITFPVQVTDGKISLRFRADSDQKYVTVMAVTAEPLAEGQECPLKETTYPASAPTVDTYKKNWERWESVYAADWDKVKAELKAEGVDFDYWSKMNAELKTQKGYCEYFPALYGSSATHWERINQYAHGISIARTCKVFAEMGMDGLAGSDPVGMRELLPNGIKYALYTGGQSFSFTMKPSNFTPNLLKDADGATSTITHALSNSDPELIEAFRKSMRAKYANVADKASFLFIDEPVEPYCAGRYGDFSKPAEESFKKWVGQRGWNEPAQKDFPERGWTKVFSRLYRKWAGQRGWKEPAQKGFPERGRTMDFYRFYQFRLESAAMFVRSFVKDTPVEKIPIVPGNGNAGEMMNHSGFWPPSFAKYGLVPTTWAYDCAASSKMYSEVARLAEEFDVRSCVTPPFGVYAHNTPLGVIPLTTACISALHWKIIPWGTAEIPNRQAWMRPIYYASRLTHATTGLTHIPPLYVWRPDSIAFNDLVELKGDETTNFKKLWSVLFQANSDYAVTSLLKIPKDAILLYACARPVLNEGEFARLKGFIEGGGTLLAAFAGEPESPDGVKITAWQDLPKERIIRTELSADALRSAASKLLKETNWETGLPAVKTYLYRRAGKKTHLLNNTDIRESAKITMPSEMQDILTGKVVKKDSTCEILPGLYALLEER